MKFLHITAIAFWCGGLICVPLLHARKRGTRTAWDRHRLQQVTRFAFIGVVSPAAFLAISSGVALIFWRQTFDPWFSLKLLFVGLLVLIHMLIGRTTVRLHKASETYAAWRRWLAVGSISFVAGAILFLVLGKPTLDMTAPGVLEQPGVLRTLVRDWWA